MHASAIAPSATTCLRLCMMADADEIVLENTEIQTEVEVETQSTRKRRRRTGSGRAMVSSEAPG